MRFGFVTCVQLGLSCMEAIYEVGGRLDLAITLEDDQARAKSGRIYLDDFCTRHDVPLCKSRNVNDAAVIAAIRAARLDWLFIIGWSQIARAEVLAAPARGVLGMHPTLLPQGRGRAAIPWAILKQLDRTGVTLFQLDEGVDTGPILAQAEIPLTPRTDAAALYATVNDAHIALMHSAYPALLADRIVPAAQDESRATLWPGRRPEDGAIDLGGSVADAERLVRAVTRPYPGAYVVRDGRKTIVWKAHVVPSGGEDAPGLRLRFRDGALHCDEWEEQSLAAADA